MLQIKFASLRKTRRKGEEKVTEGRDGSIGCRSGKAARRETENSRPRDDDISRYLGGVDRRRALRAGVQFKIVRRITIAKWPHNYTTRSKFEGVKIRVRHAELQPLREVKAMIWSLTRPRPCCFSYLRLNNVPGVYIFMQLFLHRCARCNTVISRYQKDSSS